MGLRILYGTIAIITLVAIFLLDAALARLAAGSQGALARLIRHGSLIPLLFIALAVGAGRELARLLQTTGANPHARFAILLIAVLQLTPWLSAAGWLGHGSLATDAVAIQALAILIAAIGGGILTVLRGQTRGSLHDTGSTILMVVYLGLFSSFGLHIRCAPTPSPGQGAVTLLLILLLIKASDIAAYFVGSCFGNRRLAPTISPGKTVEGAVGGVVISAVLAAALSLVLNAGVDSATGRSIENFRFETTPSSFLGGTLPGFSPPLTAAVFGAILSFAAQIGDLLESCFKRDAGAKDSGGILPQFGGILDLIDSPVLALPVAWLWLTGIGGGW